MNRPRFLTVAALSATALSGIDTRVSVFALLLNCIALAALPGPIRGHRVPRRQWPLYALLAALLANLVSLSRFVIDEAMPGISEARGRDESTRAVSRLREILFAEDALRRHAFIDHDHDGIGSAGLLGELSGTSPARGDKLLEQPPLAARFAPRVSTQRGPAFEESGFLYLVCLPRAGGGFTARPSDPIDEERAERTFIALAWPAREGLGITSTFFLDQDERIMETKAEVGSAWAGPFRVPPCDITEDPRTYELFTPWRGKLPRKHRPGDRSPG